MNIVKKLANEFEISERQVEATIDLIDEGNTIPFIARYRKEITGGLSDIVLRDMYDRLVYLRNLEERKEEILKSISEQGKLTAELETEIRAAEVLQRLEDLYKPYKQKKSTKASKAKEKGLEPLALIIFAQELEEGNIEEIAAPYVNEELEVMNTADAISGACDIIAEIIADDTLCNESVREKTFETAVIETSIIDEDNVDVFEMYADYKENVKDIPNHRVLAVNRGEKEKILKVKMQVEAELMEFIISKIVISNENSIFKELIRKTVTDAYKRLLAPSIEREIRNMLTQRAEEEAVKLFAKNTEKLLMVPPVKGARIISIDPGYRTGCKVAVLSESGKLLAYATIYPTKPKEDIAGTERILARMVEKYNINLIVIGNGTASRETEEVVANFIKKYDYDLKYTIVNEAGASVYSASKLASEEYPDLDVTTRGAMSLGKRLQDPLAELVKISPRSIGVGQYQHDINQTRLESALSNVVEDCVNRVGVELNTASPSLLSYVAGINMGIAKNIVAYREEKGKFVERKELLKVAKLGEKTFKQCAGFLRINGADNPLDATAIHPESYALAEKILSLLGIDKNKLASGGANDIEKIICSKYQPKKKMESPQKGLQALAMLKQRVNLDGDIYEKSLKNMAKDLGVSEIALREIVEEIKKPNRDPRDEAPAVIFRQDVKTFEDLKVGMKLSGTVRNVVDFGIFVDIGLKNDGFVHISEMSKAFVKHPMDLVSIGDIVEVRIIKLDPQKQKASLSMKPF
ncbi:MAG: Tex family protein [Eubacteriales bacterium]